MTRKLTEMERFLRERCWNWLHDDASLFDRYRFRLVEGVCTTTGVNANGQVVDPRAGHAVHDWVPLLISHDWGRPIGKVLNLSVRDNDLHFRARLFGEGRNAWIDEIWQAMTKGQMLGVSVGPDGTGRHYVIEELSLTDNPANDFARIDLVEEVLDPGVVSVIVDDARYRKQRRIHWDARDVRHIRRQHA